MEFHFSLKQTLKQSIGEYKAHLGLFLFLATVQLALRVVSSEYHRFWAVNLLVVIVSLIWSFVSLKLFLAVVDGKKPTISWKRLQESLPTFRQFFTLVGISLLVGIIYIAGFILLILPGLYLIGRLMFSSISFVDEGKGVITSIKHSWYITKVDGIWTALLTGIVIVVLILLGIIFFGIGLLITLPLAILIFTHLYRALTIHYTTQSPGVQIKQVG